VGSDRGPNDAFERTGLRSAHARGLPSQPFRPAARLERLRPAAQCGAPGNTMPATAWLAKNGLLSTALRSGGTTISGRSR
jgi:hypothetical protein